MNQSKHELGLAWPGRLSLRSVSRGLAVTPPMVPPQAGPAGPSTANFVAIDGPARISMAAMDGPAGLSTVP